MQIGVQDIDLLEITACLGPDPGFAGMTRRPIVGICRSFLSLS